MKASIVIVAGADNRPEFVVRLDLAPGEAGDIADAVDRYYVSEDRAALRTLLDLRNVLHQVRNVLHQVFL